MAKKMADLVVYSARELITVGGNSSSPKRMKGLEDIGIIRDGAVAVAEGKIMAVGKSEEVRRQVATDQDTVLVDATGKVVLPGFVDPHTHLVFAGSREDEFALKIKGASYLEILAQGGGILSTMAATRAASKEELALTAERYLKEMLAQGTTTAEAKSGYGLNTANEIKTLEVIRELNCRQPLELIPTFMGAHALPPEYKDRPRDFLRLLIDEMLPKVAENQLAVFCDVFCEAGVFSVDQSREILAAAQKLGLKSKIHAEEITPLGGAELAAELGATSAEHLVQITAEGIRRLAKSDTVAILLPATTFCLMGEKYAPARKLIEAGAAVALASDFNPGSSPVNSMQVVMGIACRQLRMTPAEAIAAATINAAHGIDCADRVGSIEVGKEADLVVFEAPSHRYLAYRFGTNLAETVIKGGQIVWRRGDHEQNC